MEHIDRDNLECSTDHKQVKVVCLSENILYTALVTMKMVQGDSLCLPLSIPVEAFYSNNSSILYK